MKRMIFFLTVCLMSNALFGEHSELIKAVHDLDVKKVQQLVDAGVSQGLKESDLGEMFMYLGKIIKGRHVLKERGVIACKLLAGTILSCAAARFIFKACKYNEDRGDSILQLCWRFFKGHPARVCYVGTPHYPHMPLIAASGALGVVGIGLLCDAFCSLYQRENIKVGSENIARALAIIKLLK